MPPFFFKKPLLREFLQPYIPVGTHSDGDKFSVGNIVTCSTMLFKKPAIAHSCFLTTDLKKQTNASNYKLSSRYGIGTWRYVKTYYCSAAWLKDAYTLSFTLPVKKKGYEKNVIIGRRSIREA